MKKLIAISMSGLLISLLSCSSPTATNSPSKDSTSSPAGNTLDSAANNSVLPPSAAPGNADNSSLADTTYKANPKKKDSLKK